MSEISKALTLGFLKLDILGTANWSEEPLLPRGSPSSRIFLQFKLLVHSTHLFRVLLTSILLFSSFVVYMKAEVTSVPNSTLGSRSRSVYIAYQFN